MTDQQRKLELSIRTSDQAYIAVLRKSIVADKRLSPTEAQVAEEFVDVLEGIFDRYPGVNPVAIRLAYFTGRKMITKVLQNKIAKWAGQ